MHYTELMNLYTKVVVKAKQSRREDILDFFGIRGGEELIANIQLGRSLELSWLRMLKWFNFKSFEQAAKDFLSENKEQYYIVKLDSTYFHVRNKNEVSFGVYTEEYLKRDYSTDVHLHVLVNIEGKEVETILYYAMTQEQYLVKNN